MPEHRKLIFCIWIRGPSLESPDDYRARKAVVVYMQDRGFNSFASNMIKLSVNDTKWSSLPGPALLFFIFRFENLISGLSRNGRSVSPVNGCMEEMG